MTAALASAAPPADAPEQAGSGQTSATEARPERSAIDRPAAAGDKADIKTQELVLQALALVGVTYKWGGKSPESGLDCSGLVRYVFGQSLQMALPHNALAISKLGETVEKEKLKPGDLVFFNTLKRKFSHVGIYLGDDRFIHAPTAGAGVEIVNMKDQYWQKRFDGARRLQKDAGAAGTAQK
ncbi:C40 family peptidase [Chitinivorax sp. PXF-14]|uniref:C40 family peptidase n=1 Tax=Chitinivorax sp. PXF-14 TaxID=3230488 RepID=UPI003467A6DB